VWSAKVLVGYIDGDTKRPIQRRWRAGTDRKPVGKRAAERLYADFVTQVTRGELSTATDTFGAYLSGWLDQRAGTWAATTERRNRQAVAKVSANLAALQLSQLRRGDIQEWVDGLTGSAGTVKRDHVTIQGALQDAVDGEKVGLVKNPARGVRLPEGNDPEPAPPEDDEVIRILQAAGAVDELWRDIFTFTANTGLRRGEVCGLRWCDFSDDLRFITVNRAVECLVKSNDGATWALKDAKMHQVRELPLPKAARTALQRRKGNSRPDPENYVFVEGDDPLVPVHPDRVSKLFAKVADDAKLGDIRLKDFRSYAATVLTEEVGLAMAQAFLGHKNMTTTARHHTAARKSALAAGVAAFDRLGLDQPAVMA